MAYVNTSLEAWLAVQPQLQGRKQQVLEAIKQDQHCSDKEIAERLGLPINQVTPRRGELVKLGRVYCCGVKKCDKTNMRVQMWTAY